MLGIEVALLLEVGGSLCILEPFSYFVSLLPLSTLPTEMQGEFSVIRENKINFQQ